MAAAILVVCASGCGKVKETADAAEQSEPVQKPVPKPVSEPKKEPKKEPTTEPKDDEVGESVNGQRDVWSAYFDNPAVAEEKYGQKWVEERVVFQTMKKATNDPSRWVGFFDLPKIQVIGPAGNSRSPIRNYGYHTCQFRKDADVSGLSARNLAIIRGRVVKWDDNTLFMENCVVVPKKNVEELANQSASNNPHEINREQHTCDTGRYSGPTCTSSRS